MDRRGRADAATEQEGHAAAAALARYGVSAPVRTVASGGWHCVFCGSGDARDPRGRVAGPEEYVHDPGCPWARFVDAWNGFSS